MCGISWRTRRSHRSRGPSVKDRMINVPLLRGEAVIGVISSRP